jgi:hypothetical protein
MRLWKSILSLIGCAALGACARTPGALDVRAASLHADTLNVQVGWHPDASVLDALDHGIPLDFVVAIRAQTHGALGWRQTVAVQQRRLQLRYYPLSRKYQLLDVDLARSRTYTTRSLALAALEDLRLPMPAWSPSAAVDFELDITLDRSALPGALRLAALLRPAWWLSSGEYTWHAPAA